ncbi:158_t:CDS:2, partial [Cetraspora pellucida]
TKKRKYEFAKKNQNLRHHNIAKAVSATTINNCWKAIKILSENSETNESELGETELGESELGEIELGESELDETKLDESELKVIKLNFSEVNDINILIGNLLANNKDIIKIIKHNFEDNSEVSNDDNELLSSSLVTVTEAVEALKN